MTATNPLGQAPIRSLFFQYYGPALISLLSSTIHQVINGLILGQQVGRDGLAAVGLYGPVVIVFVAFVLPLMIGEGVLVGKSLGAADQAKTQQIFQFTTSLVLVIGSIVAVSAPLIAEPLAKFLVGTANPGLVANTTSYAFWQLIGLPFFFLSMVWGTFVRADSAPNVSKNASILAAGVNLVLDILLIIGLHRGVEGASIATAIALFSGSAYLFVYIWNGNSRYSFMPFRFMLKFKQWKELLAIGAPSFASEVAFSSGLLLINHELINYGPLAVSAFGLVNYLSFILIRLFTAAMMAALPVMSFNIGAKLPHRVLAMLRFSLLFTLILGSLIAMLGFLLPDYLLTLFAGDQTAAYRQIASQAVGLYFLLFLAAGPNYILAAYLQSIGKSTVSTLINIGKGFVFVLACLLVLPGYFKLGLAGVWLSRSLAEILTLVLIGLYTLYHRDTYYTENVIVPTT